jgi:hypothetical protein
MAETKFSVSGDQYRQIHRKMREILRQLDQKDGSPLDPDWVSARLQEIVAPPARSEPVEMQEPSSYVEAPTCLPTCLTAVRASTANPAMAELPPNHYRVPVTYAPVPSMDALKKEWGKDNVSVIFDGRPFNFHASCVGMGRTPGEKTFYVHDIGHDWESEERIAWGLKQRNAAAPNGYRPATHEETYEFAKAHPELVDFVGLGSFAAGDDRRCVALVWQGVSQRILGSDWFGDRWFRRARVLFVAV